MQRILFPLAFGLCLFLVNGFSWGDEGPVGAEFQVNTYTTYGQGKPAVAMMSTGDFVVVWDNWGSSGTDTLSYSVQGQQFGIDGASVGLEFQVNTYTTESQGLPDIGMDGSGDFVVVWGSGGSAGNDSSSFSIQGQRFNSDGTVKGSEFQVNSYTTGYQSFPKVSVASGGEFVVVWVSPGSSGTDSSSKSIQAQRFDSDGIPLGSEFQVNTYTTQWQQAPDIATNATGSFVIVWESPGSSGTDPSGFGVLGQRYGSDGAMLGSEFQVNGYTSSHQEHPSIAMQLSGEYVVSWTSDGSTGSDSLSYSIQARRFDSGGSAVGLEFQVNTYTTNVQRSSSVATNLAGAFTVVWESWESPESDSDNQSVHGRRFSSAGNPEGDQFQVNTFTTGTQDVPDVAVANSGDFVVVWESYGSSGTDDDGGAVLGQRFHPNIFVDGFESGDTTAWSSTSR